MREKRGDEREEWRKKWMSNETTRIGRRQCNVFPAHLCSRKGRMKKHTARAPPFSGMGHIQVNHGPSVFPFWTKGFIAFTRTEKHTLIKPQSPD